MHDLPGSGFQEDALGGRTPLLTCLQVIAEGGGVRIGCGIGTGIDVRDLKRAMAGFVAGHLARANAVLADTTFRPALFVPPSAARLKTATWSPGVFDVDFALIATPEDTVTETGPVIDPPRRLGFIRAIPQRVPLTSEGAPRTRMQGDVTYAAQRRRNVIQFTRSCKNSQPSRSYSALTRNNATS